jgi:N6-L-threonylcarbamoyladenine synthase
MLLAFETSCDETAAAVVDHGRILSSVVSSQIKTHAEYGGVVPELAAREHLKNLLPVAREALSAAAVAPEQLEAIAATQGPGLPGALMMGLKAAESIAFALRRPFFGIHHHEAHLYSPWIRTNPARAGFSEFKPNVSLIVSGGHTMLVLVERELKHRLLGSTLDDAAGECFDKVGKLLGLPYPAGPAIDRLAAAGNPKAYDFPRPMMNDASDDFSFSGLKTSVRYFIRDHPELTNPGSSPALCDLCASVQSAIVDVLVTKLVRASNRLRAGCVTASGGVACNRQFRADLQRACNEAGIELHVAEPQFCTDNAAMIGILAERKLMLQKLETELDADIRVNWALADPSSA